jgi:hypothetical protein
MGHAILIFFMKSFVIFRTFNTKILGLNFDKKDEGLLFHYLTKKLKPTALTTLLLSFFNHWLLMPKNVLNCFHRRPETVWLECDFFRSTGD